MRPILHTLICVLLGGTPSFLHAQFGPQGLPVTGLENVGISSVVTADFDDDLDNDLVVGLGNSCIRMMNLDGTGTSWQTDTIANVITSLTPAGFGAVDMDGDADVDLVVYDPANAEVLLIRNDGTGAFDAPQLIPPSPRA